MEVNELLELSTNTFLGLKKIQSEIVTLKEQVADSQKNLSVAEKNLATSEKNISKVDATIEKAQKLSKELDKKIKVIENASPVAQAMIESLQESILELRNRMDEIEDRVDKSEKELGKIGKTVSSIGQASGNDKAAKQKTTAKAVASQFPASAMHFTMANTRSVSYTKPYGIVVDGDVLMMGHWTNMLDEAIPYCMKKYGGNVKDLCDVGYGIEISDEDGNYIIPFFISGKTDDSSYRYIAQSRLSVYSGGADRTVEVLKNLICDYLEVDERNVEIFYHKK